jgi:hypothetical protein
MTAQANTSFAPLRLCGFAALRDKKCTEPKGNTAA